MSDAIVWKLKKGQPGAPFAFVALCSKPKRQKFCASYRELGEFLVKEGAPVEEVNAALETLADEEKGGSAELTIARGN